MYSCPYHVHMGINQKEKKLLTESQRLWKKLFISSEWDAWVFTTKLFYALHSHNGCSCPAPACLWKLFGGKGWAWWLGPQQVWAPELSQDLLLCHVFLCEILQQVLCEENVRLWNVSHCVSLWSPRTKFALFLWLVAGAAADVSGAIAMKHPNCVPERKEIWLDREQS